MKLRLVLTCALVVALVLMAAFLGDGPIGPK
jgi:hypothetical protein